VELEEAVIGESLQMVDLHVEGMEDDRALRAAT